VFFFVERTYTAPTVHIKCLIWWFSAKALISVNSWTIRDWHVRTHFQEMYRLGCSTWIRNTVPYQSPYKVNPWTVRYSHVPAEISGRWSKPRPIAEGGIYGIEATDDQKPDGKASLAEIFFQKLFGKRRADQICHKIQLFAVSAIFWKQCFDCYHMLRYMSLFDVLEIRVEIMECTYAWLSHKYTRLKSIYRTSMGGSHWKKCQKQLF